MKLQLDSSPPRPSATLPELPATRLSQAPLVRNSSLPPMRPSMPSGPLIEPAIYEEWDETTEVGAEPPLRPSEPNPRPREHAVMMRMDGVNAGQVIPLSNAELVIGRHASSNLSINDHGLSRYHARITHTPSGYVLEDLTSTNGSYVQGRPIKRHVLSEGDWIQLGPRVSFRFSLADERQKDLLLQLYESSNRDALTGAYNRQYFDERLVAEVAFARRHNTMSALLLFDVDHFKQVNDTHGHPAGDAVLRFIVGTVSARLRTEDVLARIGGEEFAVLFRNIDLKGCARAGERLRRAICSLPARAQGHLIPVSVSVGCATLACTPNAEPMSLLALADRRLYAAKRAGRNRVVADG